MKFSKLKNGFSISKSNTKLLSSFIIFIFIMVISASSYSNNIIDLQNENNELTQKYESLSEEYDFLEDKYASLSDDYDEIQSEIDNYEDQQATIDDLNAKLEELHSQYDSLESERDTLQAQVDAKKAEEERLARERAAQQQAQQQASAGYGTVYWVSGGEVYHSTPNCSTLKRSSNIQSGTIAQSGKSRACKVCH